MRKYLFGEKGNFYKANLHCHSTVSDGALTPEELNKLIEEAPRNDKGQPVISDEDFKNNIIFPYKEKL